MDPVRPRVAKGEAFPFSMITGDSIRRLLFAEMSECMRVTRDAYLAHEAGHTVNPPSAFLRFPGRPHDRIIALLAHVEGQPPISGVKWIASYPENVERGFPRASAVLILNDGETGYPFACLEGSVISAARTAASAALAAHHLHSDAHRARVLGIVGTGLIARYIFRFLHSAGWVFDEIMLCDHNLSAGQRLAVQIRASGDNARIIATESASEVLAKSDLVVFATTASTPHVHDTSLVAHRPTVLHVSLRDLSPEIVLHSCNVVDDEQHVMSASTSAHLAEQLSGSRAFVSGTIADVIRGKCHLDRSRAIVFSPFGMGVLDVALGYWVYQRAVETGALVSVPNFFGDLEW